MVRTLSVALYDSATGLPPSATASRSAASAAACHCAALATVSSIASSTVSWVERTRSGRGGVGGPGEAGGPPLVGALARRPPGLAARRTRVGAGRTRGRLPLRCIGNGQLDRIEHGVVGGAHALGVGAPGMGFDQDADAV